MENNVQVDPDCGTNEYQVLVYTANLAGVYSWVSEIREGIFQSSLIRGALILGLGLVGISELLDPPLSWKY